MGATRTSRKTVKHPYITRTKGVCGGKPIVAGTRIKVSQIAMEYERMGWTPDEVTQAHPHLTLAQVHDALSFYYDHVAAINVEMRAGERTAEDIRKRHPRQRRGRRNDV